MKKIFNLAQLSEVQENDFPIQNLVFRNKKFGQIRTCTVKGETYFVGKDVASTLGYFHPTKAVITHADKEDRIMTKTVTIQGKRDTTVINESGLYSLILSSKLDSA